MNRLACGIAMWVVLAGCSRNSPPIDPAPAGAATEAAVDFTGDWRVNMIAPTSDVLSADLIISGGQDGYQALMTLPGGSAGLQSRSVTITGRRIVIDFRTQRDEPSRLDLTLRDAGFMDGRYSEGNLAGRNVTVRRR